MVSFFEGLAGGFVPSFQNAGAAFLKERGERRGRQLQEELLNTRIRGEQSRQRFEQEDRGFAAEDRAREEQERERGTAAALSQALQIQNAVDAGRASGSLTEEQIGLINASGGAEGQINALGGLLAANQASQAEAPQQAAEIAALEALARQRDARASATSQEAIPNDLLIAEAVRADPDLLNQLRAVTEAQAAPAKPEQGFTLGPDSTRFDAAGNVVAQGSKINPKDAGAEGDPRFANLSASERQTLRAGRATFQNLSGQIDNLQGLIEEGGAAFGVGEQRDKIRQAQTALELEFKELANLGVLTGPDLELVREVIPDAAPGGLDKPIEFFREISDSILGGKGLQGRSIEALERVREIARTKLRSVEDSFGPLEENFDKFTKAELLALQQELEREATDDGG